MASTRSDVKKRAEEMAKSAAEKKVAAKKKAAEAKKAAETRKPKPRIKIKAVSKPDTQPTSTAKPKPRIKIKPASEQKMTVKPSDRIAPPDAKKPSMMSRAAAAAKKAAPAARMAARVAGPVGLAATAIGALSALPDSVKKSGLSGRGQMDRKSKSRTRTEGSQASASAPATKSAEKNYNVGKSQGGVSFNEAFRHFRNSGAKEFTWNGKKYNTKLKDEK